MKDTGIFKFVHPCADGIVTGGPGPGGQSRNGTRALGTVGSGRGLLRGLILKAVLGF